jgi:hypothetical protein
MGRWIRFAVVLVVLLGMLCVGLFFVMRELDKIADEREPDVFTNPTLDIAVGDWAEYRREGGETERYEVVAVTQATYSVEILVTRENGETARTPPQVIPKLTCGVLASRFVPMTYRRERIEAGGREWDAWRIELSGGFAGKAIAWVSDDMPLGLLKRQIIRGTTVSPNYEYIRHGHAKPKSGNATPK